MYPRELIRFKREGEYSINMDGVVVMLRILLLKLGQQIGRFIQHIRFMMMGGYILQLQSCWISPAMDNTNQQSGKDMLTIHGQRRIQRRDYMHIIIRLLRMNN